MSFGRRIKEKKILINYITMTRNIDTKEFRMEIGINIPEIWDMENSTTFFGMKLVCFLLKPNIKDFKRNKSA